MSLPLRRFFKRAGLTLLPAIGAAVVWLICVTIRKSVEDKKWEELARASCPGVIYVFWHGRMLYFLYHYRGSMANILISQSSDGEIIARVLKYFGFKVVRGSKSAGGLRASYKIAQGLKRGEYVALTPDGPRGPGFHVNEGVIALASITGCPVLPMTNGFKGKKVFNSWDAFLLPYPFTRARIVYGEPLFVPKDADASVLEAKRLELENTLNEITRRADAPFI